MPEDFDRCMWRMLADNLPARAGKIAAVDSDRAVSYAALAAEAGRVAGWLRARMGAAPEAPGTCAARG